VAGVITSLGSERAFTASVESEVLQLLKLAAVRSSDMLGYSGLNT
jgi:hypothetical protein